jgi:imidazole glycerol-phosphate synthase subunit HisH
MTISVGILKVGHGNILSVVRAANNYCDSIKFVNKPEDFKTINRLIIPGVGSFGYAMQSLKERGLIDSITKSKDDGLPIFGVCLGMQLMFSKSFELGVFKGLGFFDGEVSSIKKNKDESIKVPHVGWNRVESLNKPCTLFNGKLFYFNHSFCVKNVDQTNYDVINLTNYCGTSFVSHIARENVSGAQFHPEKSGEAGLAVYENFLKKKNY